MTLHRHRRAHPVLVIAVLAFISAGIAIPIVVGGRGADVTIESASLQAAPGDTYLIASPLRLPAAPHVKIEKGTVALTDSQRARATTGEATALLIASGSARLTIRNAQIVIGEAQEDAHSPGGEQSATEDAPLASALLSLNFDAIALRDATLIFRMRDGNRIALNDVTAEIAHKRRSHLAARGTFRAAGQKLSFETTLFLQPSGKAPVRYPFKASVKGALVEAQLDGRLGIGDGFDVQGQASASISGLRPAARWLGSAWPDGPGLNDFRVKGQLDWSGTAIAFQKASLAMDGNEATGTLSLAYAAGRPSVEGTLALGTLDLSPYVSAAPKWLSPVDVLQRAAGHDGTDLTLPMVRQLDADIRISATRVRLGFAELGRSALTLSLKAGRLLADVAEFEHEDARGNGQVSVDMNADLPRFGVRGKLTGFDIGRVVSSAVGQQLLLYGRGNITLDATASGETITQMTRTLDGKASFEVSDGARLGMDLGSLLAAPQRRTLEGWGAIMRGQTSVEQISGRLVASQGVIAPEALEVTTADAIVSIGGSANLSQRTLDMRITGARRLATDAAANDPVIIKGPWANPVIRSGEAQRKASGPAGAPLSAP